MRMNESEIDRKREKEGKSLGERISEGMYGKKGEVASSLRVR